MYKSLRKYYNKETKQYVFNRDEYKEHKAIIKKALDTKTYENIYDSGEEKYHIYKTVATVA